MLAALIALLAFGPLARARGTQQRLGLALLGLAIKPYLGTKLDRRLPPRLCENAMAEGRMTAAVAGSEEPGAEGQLGIAAISGRTPMIVITRLML